MSEPNAPAADGPSGRPERPETAGDTGSSDHKTPAQQALDLLLYAPAGLVATAIEDLPELAAKGRARLEGQVKNAHFIGKLVVNLGQQDLQQRIERVRNRSDATAPPDAGSRAPSTRPGATSAATSGPGRAESPPGPSVGAPLSLHRQPEVKGDAASAVTSAPGGKRTAPVRRPNNPTAAGPVVGATAMSADASSDAVDAAIPGYDTLSASQVVRRLDGLGPRELEAVVRHESATRGRRTILHRAQQLLGTEDVPGAHGGPS